MFYLDLDEVDALSRSLKLFSRNRFNWFNFRDRDHLRFALEPKTNGPGLKEKVIQYITGLGIEFECGKIMLLTNVTTLGYSFNPISFYLCFDESDRPVCAVAEVCNTHGEMKLFLLDEKCFSEDTFRRMVPKLFYVSPFANLGSSFDFIFKIPGEGLSMRVDDYEDNKRFLLSALTGRRKKLNDATLFWYGVRFPLITVKVILLIYWQAVILYLKRIPFNKKSFNLHLQQDAYPYKKA